MPFIGNKPADSFTSFAKQDFTTSATTSYTLDYPVTNANEIALFINFVRQEPTTAYSATGTSLTLTSATSASDDMYAVFLGKALQTVNPPAGSVGTSQLANGAVTLAKTDGNFGKVLQVLQNSTTTTTSVTSTSYVDVGLSQAITPSSTSNKILVIAFCSGGSAAATSSGDDSFVALARDIGGAGYSNIGGGGNVASDAFIHWSAGNGSNGSYNDLQWSIQKGTFLYLDSPASTSECTYKLQQKNRNASKQTYFNRRGGDTLSGISYLTLMEIAG